MDGKLSARRTGLMGVASVAAMTVGLMAADAALAQQGQAAPAAATAPTAAPNPFFETWATPFGVPPFDRIQPEHFRPAFDRAWAEHKAEIDAIVNNPAPPTFENTLLAMEKAGQALRRVSGAFFVLTSTATNDRLQAVQREIAPLNAKHNSDIALNEGLFRRVAALHGQRDALTLNPEQKRLLERSHIGFTRQGAKLEGPARERFAAIQQQAASLHTKFAQNLLADEKAFYLLLEEADLAGLPDSARAAAAQAAKERGHEGKYAITLSGSSVLPFMRFSERRDLRQKLLTAFENRGNNGNENDNDGVIGELTKLRAERVQLLGFPSFAHFRLDDMMAKTPETVAKLYDTLVPPAHARFKEEEAAVRAMMAKAGATHSLERWDWAYWSEKVRTEQYDVNDAIVRPYLQLDKIIEAQFWVANRLFGLTFEEKKDVPVWHPDVRVWEVKDRDGRHVGLFYGDYFARTGKRSGAWMSVIRGQHKVDGDVRPVIYNACNFAKPPEGKPALVSFQEAETAFHEFGHALHGLLSNVTYPTLAGPFTTWDFVEFPAQIYEHWLGEPEVLQRFAIHHETGQPMPAELIERIRQSVNFNMGHFVLRQVALGKLDMNYHLATKAEPADSRAVEAMTREQMKLPELIGLTSTAFGHIFSSEGYAAGYYSYMWSEILDEDGFDAFKEAEDIFHPGLAKRLYEHVYSAGNVKDAMEAYVGFRGRPPTTDALLRNRGLLLDKQN